MSTELDYIARENFEFFSYRNEPKGFSKENFLACCQSVLETSQSALKSVFELAFNLSELHGLLGWREVVDPLTGECFIYSSFGAFCKYAFGFSETKTSNLLTVASFLERGEDGTVKFHSPNYEGYGFSQLIELDQIPSCSRRYVNPSMSVADLRLVRKYMDTMNFVTDWKGSEYNVLDRANSYFDRKKREEEEKRRIKEQAEAYKKNTLPGQITVTELSDGPVKNSDVGTAEAGGVLEEVKEPISEELRNEYLKLFKTRDGRREFLSRYNEWTHVGCVELLDNEEIYEYVFRNGTKVYAAEVNVLTVFEPYLTYDVQARFYIRTEPLMGTFIQLSKTQLEMWLASHVDEL